MLTDLREKSQSFLVYILFGILIFVFIFFFGPQADGLMQGQTRPVDPNDWALQVNGEEIPVREIEVSVRRYESGFRNARIKDLVPRLRQAALLQVMDQEIIAADAKQMGVAISDDALTRYIVGTDNPDARLFRENYELEGKFLSDKYSDLLRNSFGADSDTYRSVKRREAVISRYMGLLESAIKVSEAEARQEYDQGARTWNLEYVRFDPKNTVTAGPAPSDAEVQTYAQANADKIKSHYESKKGEFVREKIIVTKRILINKPQKDPNQSEAEFQEALAKTKARAEEARTKASEPTADFVAVSAEYSDDGLKATGGAQARQRADEKRFPDYAKVKDLAKGQLSELIENEAWFYFYKVVDVEPAIDRNLSDATPDIARIFVQEEKQKAAAEARAQTLLAHVKKTGSMASPTPPTPTDDATEGDTADTPQIEPAWPTPETTGEFREFSLPRFPGLGESEELAKKLMALTEKNQVVDTVLMVGGYYVVARLKERKEPSDDEFAKEKDNYIKLIKEQRKLQLIGDWERDLLDATGAARRLVLPPEQPEPKPSLPIVQSLKKAMDVEVNPEAYPAPAPIEAGGDTEEQQPAQ